MDISFENQVALVTGADSISATYMQPVSCLTFRNPHNDL
jgi:hypothetical protein